MRHNVYVALCRARQDFSPRLLGLGLLWAWGYAAFFLGPTASPPVAMLASFVFGMAAAVVCNDRFALLVVGRAPFLAANAVMALATPALVFAGPHSAFALAGEVATGFASAWVTGSWAMVCGRSGLGQLGATLAPGMLLAALVVAVLEALAAAPRCALLCVLPLAGAAMLRRPVHNTKWPLAHIRKTSWRATAGAIRRLLVALVAYGVCLGVLQGLVHAAPGVSGVWPAFLGGVATAALVSWAVGVVLPVQRSSDGLFRTALPVVAAALVAFCVPGVVPATVPTFLVGAGFTCVDLGVWMIMGEFALRTHASPLVVFGLARVAENGGMLLGACAGLCLVEGMLDARVVAGAAVILLCCVATAPFTGVSVVSGLMDGGGRPARGLRTRGALAHPLAEAHGLTAREEEVLALLLDGADVARVQSELDLSNSTVKTHMRHIYDKLGVHSRQELYGLCDRAA